VLNILYLVDRGLLDVPVLYLSRFIIENRSGYYQGLRRVTEEGAWEDWIVYMLEAIEATAADTRTRILDIRQALDEAVEFARERMIRGYRKELVELIFEQPYTRIRFVERAGIAKRQTASQLLNELERIGLLRGFKIGRDKLFVNPMLMDILSR
jgi:Fic family protein